VVVSLAALRNTSTPDRPVTLMAGSRVDFSTHLAAARASRGEARPLFPEATTTTTLPPPPPTTAKPKVIYKAPVTTAKPKPKPTTPTTAKAVAKPAAKPASPPPTGNAIPGATSGKPQPTGGSTADGSQTGNASWYNASYHNTNPWICAHMTLPKGTVLTVTDTNNGKSITCEVGDRGPYGGDNRILDLSEYAFSQLASPSSGVIPVKISW
jgi:rare lipoprotein A